jgi:osmotically-inducible protein OsmY
MVEANMATTNLTPTDIQVRDAVVRQLDWDPEVDAGAIGVTARDGVVTLTGFIDTYTGKLAAERSVKRVRGVRGVANDVEVRLRMARTDADVATDVVRALALSGGVPGTVQAVVHNGHVTLTGTVSWMFQKIGAEKAIRHVTGVRGVHNHIAVTPQAVARDLRHRIVGALHRHADLDAHRISIHVAGDVATLTGVVGSWLQRDAAERAAASAPGIARVDNQIVVEPERPLEDVVDEEC